VGVEETEATALLEQQLGDCGSHRGAVPAVSVLGWCVDRTDPNPVRSRAAEAGQGDGAPGVVPEAEAPMLVDEPGLDAALEPRAVAAVAVAAESFGGECPAPVEHEGPIGLAGEPHGPGHRVRRDQP